MDQTELQLSREKYRRPAMFIFGCLVAFAFILSILFRIFGPPEIKLTVQKRLTLSELEAVLKPGDLIFQTTVSRQSGPIAKATHSPLTHVGIAYKEKDSWMVLEATEPVKVTSLEEFKNTGRGSAVCVRRPQFDFDIDQVISEGSRYLGQKYDLLFAWDDQRMYCSELVYKAFERATGQKIGDLQPVESLDFSAIAVQELMIHRLGLNLSWSQRASYHSSLFRHKTIKAWRNSPDWDATMFSEDTIRFFEAPILTPISQFRSPLLTTVYCELQTEWPQK